MQSFNQAAEGALPLERKRENSWPSEIISCWIQSVCWRDLHSFLLYLYLEAGAFQDKKHETSGVVYSKVQVFSLRQSITEQAGVLLKSIRASFFFFQYFGIQGQKRPLIYLFFSWHIAKLLASSGCFYGSVESYCCARAWNVCGNQISKIHFVDVEKEKHP